MDRQSVYREISEYMSFKNWRSITFVIIMSALILNILEAVIVGTNQTNVLLINQFVVFDQGGFSINFDIKNIFSALMVSKINIKHLIYNIVSALFSAGISYEILRSFKSQENVKLTGVFNAIKDNFVPLASVTLVTGITFYLLELIPLIGWILSLVVGYMLAYSIFLIQDYPQENLVFYLKTSNDMMVNHKFNLFMAEMKYIIKPLIALVVSFLIIIILCLMNFDQTLNAGLFLFFVFSSLLVVLIITMIYTPYIMVVGPIYYQLYKNQ